MNDYEDFIKDDNELKFRALSQNNSSYSSSDIVYSAEVMRDKLIEKMQEVNDRIKSIREKLHDNENVKKRLLAELRTNEKIFNDLVTLAQNVRLDSSVSSDIINGINKEEDNIALNDQRLKQLEDEIIENSRRLVSLNGSSEFLDIIKKDNITKEIELLKQKSGNIRDGQRKIINSVLNKYYKKILRGSRKYGSIQAKKELKLGINNFFEEKSNEDKYRGVLLFDPYDGTNLDYIADALMSNKKRGMHCYAIFNGIELDNRNFNSREEIISVCNSYLDSNNKGVSK